jgi:hypothetical protein
MEDSVAEFSDLVAKLLAEQAEEEKLTQTNPLLEETQARLRDQLKTEGGPAIARLKEISASDDFQAISLIQRRLNLSRLMAAGVNADVVATLESTLRQFMGLHSSSLVTLEIKIPRRISDLTPADILPGCYQEPSIADRIAKDIRTTVANVPEIESRVEGLKRLIERVASGPRRDVDMLSLNEPDLMASRKSNPSFQITEDLIARNA